MALTVNSVSPQSLQVTFGQVVEISATIDSTTSLVGQIIRVFPGLFEPTEFTIPYQNATNYFEITYPVSGTVLMNWVGSKKYQNLTLNLQFVSTTQFNLHFDFLVGADRYTINDNLNPLEILTPQSLFYSIYEQLRFLNLHVFVGTSISSPDRVTVSVPTEGRYVKYRGEDNFQFNLRRLTTGETVARPIAGEDLQVDFSMENLTGGLNASYDLIIFNTSFCAKNDQLLTLIENLQLEGATSPTPTPLPSLPATNINGMTNISLVEVGEDDYKGSFIINGSRFIRGCEITFIIVVTDIVNRKYSYLFSTVPDEEAVPNPIVSLSGLIDGDNTLYSTSCFGDIAPCQKIQLYSEMDIDSYNDEVASLGLTGNYSDNLITINVYALNHLPVVNEDLSQYPILDEVGGPPLLPGAAYFIYQVPADAEGVTFIIFDYVFKDHSIRVPFKLLHPVYTFETIEFYDADDNLINRCYDYENGLKVKLKTADLNEFDWNRLAIYSDGDEVEIIDGTFTGSSTEINFTVDLDKANPGDCFCAVGSRAPAGNVSTGPCIANNINVIQNNYALNRFSIVMTKGLGPGFAFPRSYLTIKRNGIILYEVYLDDPWTAPIVNQFNAEFLNQNTLTYELFIYTNDGCNYYKMFTLTTNRFVNDFDQIYFDIEDACFAGSS